MNDGLIVDFDAMAHHVRVDYAGYGDKVARRNEELRVWTAELRSEASSAVDRAAGTSSLRSWLGFFQDRHLTLVDTQSRDSIRRAPDGGTAPGLDRLRDDAVLLRVPTCDISQTAVMTEVLARNRDLVETARFLLIDLRGNTGGTDSIFDELLPVLYTDPIVSIGCDYWGSIGNAAYVRQMAEGHGFPEEISAFLGELATAMQHHPGAFVPGPPDREIAFEEIRSAPERIGILMDNRCASAAEEFLLLARQSRKVVLFGSNSRGCLDYSNVRKIPLPSGSRVLGVPMSRSRRLPQSPVDGQGVAPDVRLAEGEEDPVGFVLGYLESLDVESA